MTRVICTQFDESERQSPALVGKVSMPIQCEFLKAGPIWAVAKGDLSATWSFLYWKPFFFFSANKFQPKTITVD